MKKLFTLIALLATVVSGAWADDYTTYYSNDYEDNVVQWTTNTSGRYTPLIMTDDTKYMSVNQDQRNNNGCTLTSNETNAKVTAGTDFTFICRVKLGASTDQTATAFKIFDASNSTAILTLAEVTKNATSWTINGNSEQKVAVSAGGDKTIAQLSWVKLQITCSGGKTYLTVKDASNAVIGNYDKTVITNTATGGLGKMTFATSRYNANFAIDDILVRSVIDGDVPSTPTYDCTVNYKFNDAVIKTVSGSEYEGTVVNAQSPIVIDGQKYFATSTPLSMTISTNAANNVLDVVLRKADVYNWTAKTSLNTELATGSTVEGDNASYKYAQYINVDGTLYGAAIQSSDPWWGKSFTPTQNNQVETVTYTATDNTNVVFFTETEDIDGAVKITGGNSNIRCSMGACGFYEGELVTLQPGMYTLSTSVWGNTTSPATVITFKAGETTILEQETKGYIQKATSKIFTITEPTAITISGSVNSSNAPKATDYIYIQSIPATVPVTIGADGYATFVAPYPVDFSGNEIEAFAVSAVDATTATLTKVTAVPAGEAVIVKGATGTVNVVASADAITNQMKVAAADIAYSAEAENINYVLAKYEGNVGLYRVTSGTIAKGKGYLPVANPAAEAKGGLKFVIEGVTAADAIEAEAETVKAGKYATPNGIVIVKNGVKYNVAGMMK